MSVNKRRTLRRLYALLVLLAGIGVLLLALQLIGAGASFWQQIETLPLPMRMGVIVLVFAIAIATGWLTMRVLRPPLRSARKVAMVSRDEIEARLAVLNLEEHASTVAPVKSINEELALLDARAKDPARYIAVFGDVSAGKSSLINALFGVQQATGVRAGTTQNVVVQSVQWLGQRLNVADVPGINERDGAVRAVQAREEALRSHLVLYVCDGDLTRTQNEELVWLRQFDKPIWIVLSKIDRLDETSRQTLLRSLRERTGLKVLPISAGGRAEVEVVHPDGHVERQWRERRADVDTVAAALRLFLQEKREPLEANRVKSVLRSVDVKLEVLEKHQRGEAAQRVIQNGSRNAVIGAMASVAPGSDLVIQGVLALKMLRELAAVHGVSVKEVDLERLVKLAGGKLRASSSVLLALAGNAAKAFPGLGTVGGGLLHAVAYGMVFHSLGHAVSEAMAQRRDVDRDQVLDSFARRLGDTEVLLRLAPQWLQWAIQPRSEKAGDDV